MDNSGESIIEIFLNENGNEGNSKPINNKHNSMPKPEFFRQEKLIAFIIESNGVYKLIFTHLQINITLRQIIRH
jgi:hypothetical protein